MQVKISQAKSIIAKAVRAGLVTMLVGSPGIGKSMIIHGVANDYRLKVIDLRLSQCDPTDLNGMPNVEQGRASYAPMDTFPLEGDAIPEGYNGWLLFLDEFNSAPPAVQCAAYKIVLDRMIGTHKLHKNVAIVCAGNLETDNAIVQPMSTALQSRLMHLELLVDHKEWVNWASEKGISHMITSYINWKPGNLYTFSPDHSDKTYACPRTWEFADRVLNVTDDNEFDRKAMLAGVISEGVAREFIGFMAIHSDLPSIETIKASPETVKMPVEPSILYALTGALAHNATPDNLPQLMKFIQRMPIEFQVVCLRETLKRNPVLITNTAITKWISTSSVELF